MRFIVTVLAVIIAFAAAIWMIALGNAGTSTQRQESSDERSSADPAPLESNRAALLEDVTGPGGQEPSESVQQAIEEASRIYIHALEAASSEMADFEPAAFRTDASSLYAALEQLDTWVGLSEVGETQVLDDEQESQRLAFRSDVIETQRQALRQLRRDLRFAPSFSDWDIACTAVGRFGRLLECESRQFRYAEDVKRFHNRYRALFLRLRFHEIRYRPLVASATRYFPYELDVPADDELIVWSNGGYRLAR